jgi:hypothetical protein
VIAPNFNSVNVAKKKLLAMDRGREVAVEPYSDEEVKTWLPSDRLTPNAMRLSGRDRPAAAAS